MPTRASRCRARRREPKASMNICTTSPRTDAGGLRGQHREIVSALPALSAQTDQTFTVILYHGTLGASCGGMPNICYQQPMLDKCPSAHSQTSPRALPVLVGHHRTRRRMLTTLLPPTGSSCGRVGDANLVWRAFTSIWRNSANRNGAKVLICA
jgi:hypothetical protein